MAEAAPSETRMLRYRRLERSQAVVALWPIPDAALEHATFRNGDDVVGLEPGLNHAQANLALGYLRRGALIDAEVAGRSDLLSEAEVLLRGKRWDPLAAALGAYLLLRQHPSDDRMERLSMRLREYNPRLTDAYCIASERLARRGENEAALEELLKGFNEMGLPFFTDGFTLAARHLTRILRCDRRDVPWLDDVRQSQASLLLSRLDWLAAYRVLGRPVLTFQGFDPIVGPQYDDFLSIADES
jgi:hypothetical protein